MHGCLIIYKCVIKHTDTAQRILTMHLNRFQVSELMFLAELQDAIHLFLSHATVVLEVSNMDAPNIVCNICVSNS